MTVKQNPKMRTGMRIFLTCGLVLFSLLFVISCGTPAITDEEEATPTSTEPKISDFAFVPPTITVSAGTTVTWTNNDSVAHTVTTRSTLFDSGNLSRSDTFSYTFAQSGTFEYYCTIHPYMTGKVIVE